MQKLEPGTIARCRHGYLGLITNVHPRKDHTLFVGIHLAKDGRAGQVWQSRQPQYVSHVEKLDR